MAGSGYKKKYMKKQQQEQEHPFVKLFLISFCVMLLIFTFLIKSFSPSVDVSIGDYKQDSEIDNVDESKKIVDGRLAMIQDEDQGKTFSDLMKKPDDINIDAENSSAKQAENTDSVAEAIAPQVSEPFYKVYIGSYTSAEQAKVAKDIILESGANLNPIVKCIGSNNYTLQVGTFKNKNSAETLLYTIQQNHLPGRIVQEY